jgi:hypothetical protein
MYTKANFLFINTGNISILQDSGTASDGIEPVGTLVRAASKQCSMDLPLVRLEAAAR